MVRSLIIAGYSGALLEFLIEKKNIESGKIILLEDDKEKVKLVENFGLTSIKTITFAEGEKFIQNDKSEKNIYICVSSIPAKRYQVFKRMGIFIKNHYPNLFQSSAKVSKFCCLDEGIYLGEFTTIETNATVERFCFVNSHSHIGHDSKIGKFSILGGSVIINGNCEIQDFCLLGSGVTVINGKKIGKGSVIQAGTCITQNIPPYSFVSGNPLKIISLQILGKNFIVLE